MNYTEIESFFDTTSFNPEPFVDVALENKEIREKLIDNIIDGEKHINYYFNSYLIIKEASLRRPDLFYSYWNEIWKLHKHKNSYYRMIAHDLIKNLIVCDNENKFEYILLEYTNLPRREKISNFLQMSQNLLVVNQTINISVQLYELLNDDELLSKFTERQRKRIRELSKSVDSEH